MIITRNTSKTVTIDGEPGDRIGGIDADGDTIDTLTLRWAGRTDLRDRLIACLRAIKTQDPADLDETGMEARAERARLLDNMIHSLPAYRVRRVWVGHNA